MIEYKKDYRKIMQKLEKEIINTAKDLSEAKAELIKASDYYEDPSQW